MLCVTEYCAAGRVLLVLATDWSVQFREYSVDLMEEKTLKGLITRKLVVFNEKVASRY